MRMAITLQSVSSEDWKSNAPAIPAGTRVEYIRRFNNFYGIHDEIRYNGRTYYVRVGSLRILSQKDSLAELIYSLELHEIKSVPLENGIVKIVRVPGGWLYSTDYTNNIVFVPFNNEFKSKTKKSKKQKEQNNDRE